MSKIRLDFSDLFTAVLKNLEINLLAFPVEEHFSMGDNKYFEALKKDWNPDDTLICYPASPSLTGELNINKSRTLVFSDKAYDEMREEGVKGLDFFARRPKNLLFTWEIKFNEIIFLIFKEVRKVDHHIIRIKGHDFKQEENRSIPTT